MRDVRAITVICLALWALIVAVNDTNPLLAIAGWALIPPAARAIHQHHTDTTRDRWADTTAALRRATTRGRCT